VTDVLVVAVAFVRHGLCCLTSDGALFSLSTWPSRVMIMAASATDYFALSEQRPTDTRTTVVLVVIITINDSNDVCT
jgi:hypothetical protein